VKKTFFVILVLLIIFCFSTNVFGAGDCDYPDAEVYAEFSEYAVEPGSEVYLDIYIEDMADVSSVSVVLEYDPNLLEVIDSTSPVDDSYGIFVNSGFEYTSYINHDVDNNLISYEAFLQDMTVIENVYDEFLCEIAFRVKNDAVLPNSFDLQISNNLVDLDNEEANLIVKILDSQENEIEYVGKGETLEIHEFDGEILLDWYGEEEIDLDAWLFVPNEQTENYYIVNSNNTGDLYGGPNALLINEDNLDEEGSENILYKNNLKPGTKFSVYCNAEEMCPYHSLYLPIEEADIFVEITEMSEEHLFDISNASGEGIWWHVFEVDEQGNIVEVNEISYDNPEEFYEKCYPPDLEVISDFGGIKNQNIVTLNGIVYNSIENFDEVDIFVNGDWQSSVDLLDDGTFTTDVMLESGVNNVTVKYEYGEGYYTGASTEMYWETFRMNEHAVYNEDLGKYNGDVVLEFDKEEIDDDYMQQLYGEIYKIIRSEEQMIKELIKENQLFVFDIENEEYEGEINDIDFEIGGDYFVKLYSDESRTNLIKNGYFGIWPGIEFISREVIDGVLYAEGYLAFYEENECGYPDYNSFKVYLNEGTGVDVTTNKNGYFTNELNLETGENEIDFVLRYDYGYCSGVTGYSFNRYLEDFKTIDYYHSTSEGYEFFINSNNLDTVQSQLYGVVYEYDENEDYIQVSNNIIFSENNNEEYTAELNDILNVGKHKIVLYDYNDTYIDTYIFQMKPLIHVTNPLLHGSSLQQNIIVEGYISNYEDTQNGTLYLGLNDNDNIEINTTDGSFSIPITLREGDNQFNLNYSCVFEESTYSTDTWGEIDYIQSATAIIGKISPQSSGIYGVSEENVIKAVTDSIEDYEYDEIFYLPEAAQNIYEVFINF
jgi:hypothetical protein